MNALKENRYFGNLELQINDDPYNLNGSGMAEAYTAWRNSVKSNCSDILISCLMWSKDEWADFVSELDKANIDSFVIVGTDPKLFGMLYRCKEMGDVEFEPRKYDSTEYGLNVRDQEPRGWIDYTITRKGSKGLFFSLWALRDLGWTTLEPVEVDEKNQYGLRVSRSRPRLVVSI